MELREYQKHGVDLLVNSPRGAALHWEMGLGKTLTTLVALEQMYDRLDVRRVLVVAPVRVAKEVWPAEVARWGSGLKCEVLDGTASQRAAVIERDEADVYCIGRELFTWLVKWHRLQGREWGYDCVVLDEAQSFKTAGTKRYRAIRSVLGDIERVIELTGTPTPNGLLELWPQLYLIDRGETLGRTFTSYKTKWFRRGFNGYGWEELPGAREEITRLADRYCHSLKADGHVDLPEKIIVDVSVPLSEKEMREYRKLERDALLELPEGEVITAVNAGVLVGKLSQAASGAMYVDEEGGYRETHTRKVEALREHLEGLEGHPCLIAYNYRSEAARIREVCPGVVDVREAGAIAAWNRGEIERLMLHPASAGHGLNLQFGGRHLIWFSLPWSLELYEQTNARLHRPGQTGSVIIHRLMCPDTVDVRVAGCLSDKKMDMDWFMQQTRLAA